MADVVRALLFWDGTNRIYHHHNLLRPVLEEAGAELLTPTLGEFPAPEQLAVPALQDVSVWFVGPEYVTRGIMEQVPSLKVVQRIGTGYDKVDVAAATDLGIVVSRTPGITSGAVAEHTFALMLAIAGRIPWYDRVMRTGEWTTAVRPDLTGATLGIIGLGSIGKVVAMRALAFEMTVLAYDPFQDDAFAKAHNVTYADLDTVLASSDFVSLHLPLSDETRGLIDDQALSKMKPTAYLINTARGPLVDEPAVCRALVAGTVAGYGADVFAHWPIAPDDPLLQFDNVVVTPWVAAATQGTNKLTNRAAARTALQLLNGETVPPGFVVNPEVLPYWRGKK